MTEHKEIVAGWTTEQICAIAEDRCRRCEDQYAIAAALARIINRHVDRKEQSLPLSEEQVIEEIREVVKRVFPKPMTRENIAFTGKPPWEERVNLGNGTSVWRECSPVQR